jgi:hypothetical protein
MRVGRLGRHVREQNWLAVGIDLAVVVLGILLAFQIDRWREQRADRAMEVAYIARLVADIETDIPNIRGSLVLAEERLGFAKLLMEAVHNSDVAMAEPARFLVAVQAASYTNVPVLASYTFEDLRATGNLSRIRSQEIKRALYDYYGYDEVRRQWMQLALDSEQHYFEIVAGVTDYDQERWVLENWSNKPDLTRDRLREFELDPGPVLAALERLRARQQVVDYLPLVHSGQQESVHENQRRLAFAESLLEELRDYSAEIGG